MWTLLLLAATVRSFAHMPLGISDRNTTKIFEETVTNSTKQGSYAILNVTFQAFLRPFPDFNFSERHTQVNYRRYHI